MSMKQQARKLFTAGLLLLALTGAVPVAAQVAAEDERAPQQAVGKESDTPIYADEIENGVYDIEVESSSSMFRITDCVLTVEDDTMRAVLTLSGTGYSMLFMGTGEEAIAADPSGYAEFVEDAEGHYTYTVPVAALNTALECTGFSIRKEKWYDHEISFRAETLPAGVGPILIIEQEKTDLADGVYTAALTMTGGSGKASIESPAVLTVKGGLATARLVWSSKNYDYMIVNGETYLPVNTDGNSTFEVPVLMFDAPFSVIGDTTAMSEPHEITYQLTFDSATVQRSQSGRIGQIVGVVLAAVGVVLIYLIARTIGQRKQK